MHDGILVDRRHTYWLVCEWPCAGKFNLLGLRTKRLPSSSTAWPVIVFKLCGLQHWQ